MKCIGVLFSFISMVRLGQGFVIIGKTNQHLPSTQLESTSTNQPSSVIQNKAKPRTGFAQTLLDLALNSPLWKLILVPEARKNIVKTAEANGIRWGESYNWIKTQHGPWNDDKLLTELFAVDRSYAQ